MSKDNLDPDEQPVLCEFPESPELAEFWKSLFATAWTMYETLQDRRLQNGSPINSNIKEQAGAQECAR